MGKTNKKHMKNYYEILEVDKNASNEIIEKSYKLLAKRYHPDLQNTKSTKEKNSNQEKMKEINEAYAVLSNDFKRREYDKQIKETTISIEEYNKVIQENNMLRRKLQRFENKYNVPVESNFSSLEFAQRYFGGLKSQGNKNAQVKNSKNMNTKKFKLNSKQIKIAIVVVFELILTMWILSVIPTTRHFFENLYNNNAIIRFIFDTFRDTFTM